jgi:hypothetical protein
MVSKEELAPHVEDISRALGIEKVQKQNIDIEKE